MKEIKTLKQINKLQQEINIVHRKELNILHKKQDE